MAVMNSSTDWSGACVMALRSEHEMASSGGHLVAKAVKKASASAVTSGGKAEAHALAFPHIRPKAASTLRRN